MRKPIYPILFVLAAAVCGCQNQPQLYKDTHLLMGTFIEVTSPDKFASGIVFQEMARIEKLLSKYDPQSEISRLNQKGELKASPDTFFIIKRSVEFSNASQGAFDITVAPLMDLWGFTDRNFKVPKNEEIKKTLTLIGSGKINLQEDGFVVKFAFQGVKIDLGGIAKGYALDCAANKLRSLGIKNCLINAGGQVYAMGNKLGAPWKVGIRDPRTRSMRGFLELKDRSISTSGNYEQFFVKDGLRYSHIMDPRTGRPAASEITAVTVVANDGLTADALSTAIFVLGKEKGETLAKNFPGTEIKIYEEKIH